MQFYHVGYGQSFIPLVPVVIHAKAWLYPYLQKRFRFILHGVLTSDRGCCQRGRGASCVRCSFRGGGHLVVFRV